MEALGGGCMDFSFKISMVKVSRNYSFYLRCRLKNFFSCSWAVGKADCIEMEEGVSGHWMRWDPGCVEGSLA